MQRYASPTTPEWVIRTGEVQVPTDDAYEPPGKIVTPVQKVATGGWLAALFPLILAATEDPWWVVGTVALGAGTTGGCLLWRKLAREHESVETWRYQREAAAANVALTDALGTSIADYGWVLYRAWARADRNNDLNSKTEIRGAFARLNQAAGQRKLDGVAIRALVADVNDLARELEQ